MGAGNQATPLVRVPDSECYCPPNAPTSSSTAPSHLPQATHSQQLSPPHPFYCNIGRLSLLPTISAWTLFSLGVLLISADYHRRNPIPIHGTTDMTNMCTILCFICIVHELILFQHANFCHIGIRFHYRATLYIEVITTHSLK